MNVQGFVLLCSFRNGHNRVLNVLGFVLPCRKLSLGKVTAVPWIGGLLVRISSVYLTVSGLGLGFKLARVECGVAVLYISASERFRTSLDS